jgi:hypothetical protein
MAKRFEAPRNREAAVRFDRAGKAKAASGEVPPGVASKDVPFGWVELVSGDPALRLRVRMGEGAPTVTGGYGGWQEVERPGRVALAHWKGASPLRLTLDLLFDGFDAGKSVEPALRDLERMTRRHANRASSPVLHVGGAVPHGNWSWVIEDIDWGDALRRSSDGHRVRQAVGVRLMQWVVDDLVVEGAAARARFMKARTGTVTVRSDENLRAVAKRAKVGVSALARANAIRDPKRKLSTNRVLRLP